MIISRTPFRISFFGGGTDYPAWYRRHGGAVLGTTINKYCHITCRYLPPFFEHRIRVVYSKIENCWTIDEIAHPAAREVLRFSNLDYGVEIHHDGDLPARSGLGSSSAFTVGLLHALYALKGQMPDKARLARESIHIEQEMIRETVGSQDQVFVAHGGLTHITFSTNDEISARPLTISSERTAELNSSLMLFFTGINRTASQVADTYAQDLESKEQQMHDISGMVEEGLRILAGSEDIGRFGKLLHEAWKSKQSLSSSVSNCQVESIYENAREAGALGGKLLGAGGGGFMLLFARPEDQARVRERLNKLLHVPFKFEYAGSQIIFFDPEDDYSAEQHARSKQRLEHFEELGSLKHES